ncbi:MAG: antibiotic biosynthesis monooxygenase [Bacteroidales bacterium]|nr:antibiotic biosynthesis monooxygenase [Bacteroidales bacterium]
MIRLNCFFQAKKGKYQEALEAAIALVAKSRLHPGCIAYDAFESATRPDIFTIIETWADQESLDAHSRTPEFIEYVGIMQKCGTLSVEAFNK